MAILDLNKEMWTKEELELITLKDGSSLYVPVSLIHVIEAVVRKIDQETEAHE